MALPTFPALRPGAWEEMLDRTSTVHRIAQEIAACDDDDPVSILSWLAVAIASVLRQTEGSSGGLPHIMAEYTPRLVPYLWAGGVFGPVMPGFFQTPAPPDPAARQGEVRPGGEREGHHRPPPSSHGLPETLQDGQDMKFEGSDHESRQGETTLVASDFDSRQGETSLLAGQVAAPRQGPPRPDKDIEPPDSGEAGNNSRRAFGRGKKREFPDNVCQCSGTCGARSCMRGKNAFYRYGASSICKIRPHPGERRCIRCTCEVLMCTSPRHGGRWCKAHRKEREPSIGHYSNMLVANAKLDRSWPVPLKLVAKVSFALERMTPTDLAALVKSKLQPTHFGIVKFFLAHTLKWPFVVEEFLSATADSDTADQLAVAYRSSILAASGHECSEMFSRMNSGLMNAQTGAAVTAAEFGILSKTASTDTDVPVRLGPAQTEYFMVPADSQTMRTFAAKVATMLSRAEEANIMWPTDHGDFAWDAFADAACEIAKVFRNECGLAGGKSPIYQYKVKSFTRAFLLAVGTSWDPAGQGLAKYPFGQLLGWTPDERSHCECLEREGVAKVARAFGTHPLMISCWTCLFGSLKPIEQELLLKAPSCDIANVLDDDEVRMEQLPERDRFAMGPRALAAAVAQHRDSEAEEDDRSQPRQLPASTASAAGDAPATQNKRLRKTSSKANGR